MLTAAMHHTQNHNFTDLACPPLPYSWQWFVPRAQHGMLQPPPHPYFEEDNAQQTHMSVETTPLEATHTKDSQCIW